MELTNALYGGGFGINSRGRHVRNRYFDDQNRRGLRRAEIKETRSRKLMLEIDMDTWSYWSSKPVSSR